MKNGFTCSTYFAVFQNMYDAILASEVPIEELGLEPQLYSPDDIVKVTLQSKFRNTNSSYVFNPIEETPNLYLELAKISNDKELLSFINIYGLPLGESNRILDPHQETLIICDMNLDNFYSEVSMLKNVLSLWYSIQNGKTPDKNVVERLAWEMSNSTEGFDDWLFWKKHRGNKGLNTLEVIADALNYKQKWNWDFIATKDLKRNIRIDSLLDAALFQLSEAILAKTPMRKCLNCDSIFEVTHDSQKFCSPKLHRKRSTCENSYRTRNSRQRKKETK